MKNTVKLDALHSIVTQPSLDGVMVQIFTGPLPVINKRLTPEQCSALIFGLEQALEALEITKRADA